MQGHQQNLQSAEAFSQTRDNDALKSMQSCRTLVQGALPGDDALERDRDEQDASSFTSIDLTEYTTASSSPSASTPASSAQPENMERDGTDPKPLERTASGPSYSVFTERQRQYIIFMASFGGFFSPLSANIYFPALNAIAKDLKVSSGVINLTLTSYMIFQGLAPSIFGDLGDMVGRRPAYILGFIIYIGANVGLALQNNYAALLILRCVQSTGSSGTVALGSGVAADIASSGERGKYIGFTSFGPMVAPALGPILGGVLTQYLGWRSLFWFLTVTAVAYMIPFCITFPETGRNVVGNGSIPPQGWNMSLLNYIKSREEHDEDGLRRKTSRQEKEAARSKLARQRKLRWPNPMKTLHIVVEKDVSIILLYNSVVYTAFYAMMSSLPSLFAEIYHLNDFQIGLCFMPFGVGCTIASVAGGYFMDYNYKRVATKAGFRIDKKRGDDMRNFPLEEARIQVIWPMVYFGIAAYVAYGWALEQNAHLAVPLILTFIIALSFTGAFIVMSTMLVDLYPYSPSTATAANNLVRCLMGAAGTAIIIQMIDGMGRGWAYTFVAATVYATSPLLWVVTKRGPKWREERRMRIEKHKEEAASKAVETEKRADEDVGKT